jgi:glycosidase
MKKIVLFFLLSLLVTNFSLPGIKINNKSLTVWKRDQVITGTITNLPAASGILFINDKSIPFDLQDSTFNVPVTLADGVNNIYIKVDSLGTEIVSDTVNLTLGYKIRPDLFIYSEVSGRTVEIKGQVLENPDSSTLAFSWMQDATNPVQLAASVINDTLLSLTIPEGTPAGEYYFDLYAVEPDGDTSKARTFFTVTPGNINPFLIKDDYSAWIDSAIIYEITPYIFVNRGKFSNITRKIPEIVQLGVNTIWLQPVMKSKWGGQGYDIVDYFNVRTDLGTEADLRELIATARSYGLRVMFDFVANHTSIYHSYAESSKEGPSSYYYYFYQREEDNAPYSQHYRHYQGFINYFWNDLPNLNYDNPEVQKWITEAAKYWVDKFDIDGYRFDAVWGVTARNPEFTKQLRLELKKIKPELLLLAEDKASQPQVFDERFDAAYDWAPGYDWVSQWMWAYDYDENLNPTIFNNGSNRSSLLRSALNNFGNGYTPGAKILRYIGNNDIWPFIRHHGIERTRMAAALLFSLNGIPLIYNGQETGFEDFPYETEFIFYPGLPMNYDDNYGLFGYYKRLCEIRKSYSSLISNNLAEVPVTPSANVFAFRRWNDEQNIFTVLNMASAGANVSMTLPVSELSLDSMKTYYLTDLISGFSLQGQPGDLARIDFRLPGYSAMVMLLADSIPTVVSVEDNNEEEIIPQEFELSQNYPNPFNPVTAFNYSIRERGLVSLKIYDILGKETAVLVNEEKQPGKYEVKFNGAGLASGVYFAKLTSGSEQVVRKIILLK